jgi:opacity protein-like surface antigen
MRRIVFVAIVLAGFCVVGSPASAQERGRFAQGFGGLRLGSVASTDLAVGGLVAGSLTPNIQVVGEAGRISNVLPSTVDTLLVFSPIGVGLSSWYGQGGVRFTSATSGIRPYAETSAGFARLHTEVAGFGSGNTLLANAALRFLDRTYPMATVGGGATFESGRFVADVGYRYRRIFSDDWVTLLSLARPLNVSEVRLGVGFRF